MRGIISITPRLRNRAEFLHSVEMSSDLRMAGRSCCRICMTAETARSILCSIRDSGILAFHLTMAPGSIAPALVACVLWILVFLQYRESFKGIFSAKAATQA